MKIVAALTHAASSGIVWCAGRLAFRNQRSDWLQEWRSELWYVNRASCEQSASALEHGKTVAAFCLGAFEDAWCMRRDHGKAAKLKAKASLSAVQCTGVLGLIAMSTLIAAFLLPGVRWAISSSPYKDSRQIVLISPSSLSSTARPLIEMKQFRLWRKRRQHLFSEFAFYQPVLKPVRIGAHYTPELTVARASGNLLAMLGIRPLLVAENDPALKEMPTLLVSEAVWTREFHSDSRLLGSTVNVGLWKVRLGGVINKEAWKLPGTFDAWLLEPGTGSPAVADDARGFVVAHLFPSLENMNHGEQWAMSAPQPGGDMGTYVCVALSLMERTPLSIYIFTVLLAMLALPATTSLPLGEYPSNGDHLSWAIRLRRWMFLGVKFGLILPTIYLGSLDLAHGMASDPVMVEYIQIVASFSMALFGFRWALKDQRRRCPVCLCKLTHPVRVGQPSLSFLGWNGTELICTGGHGLLHVPELPTSWFGTQRWLYLDPSWSSLFPTAI